MPAQAPNFIAKGDISPSRFVKQSGDHGVAQAGLYNEAIGVSHEGSRTAPITGVTPLAAIATEPVAVYTEGFSCEIVAGDTIVAGDKLVPDADGKAIPALGGMIYSALAKAGAASGERVKAIVQRGSITGDGVLAAAPQALTGAGAINVTSYYTAWTSGGAVAGTLANGTFIGQRKKIVLVVAGGNGTLTPTSLAGGTTITFSTVGDMVVLRWNGTSWDVIERRNEATGSPSTPALA